MPPDRVWLSTQLRDPDALAALKTAYARYRNLRILRLHPQAGDDQYVSERMHQPSLGPSPFERRMAH